jgi:hypothetical protein
MRTVRLIPIDSDGTRIRRNGRTMTDDRWLDDDDLDWDDGEDLDWDE